MGVVNRRNSGIIAYKMNRELKNIIKALLEARYLKRVKRAGTELFLGPEVSESVVEHSFYTSLWAIIMQHYNPKLNLGKLLTMCLIHDLEEVRTGDLNQVNRLYYPDNPELKAFSDMWKGSKLGENLIGIHKERAEMKTNEAQASRDCDTLAELVTEKEYLEMGKKEAKEWMEFTLKRLKTETGKQLAQAVIKARMSEWWEEFKNAIRKHHGVKQVDYRQKS